MDPAIFVSIINGIQEKKLHKTWLNKVFHEQIVDKIYNVPEAKQLEIEKIYAELLAEIKEMVDNRISPDHPKALKSAQTLIDLATELIFHP